MPSTITFLGFGLIGGSIAAAVRAGGERTRLAAWTPAGGGPRDGLRLGLIDEAAPTPEAALDTAELVILAGPPLAIRSGLGELAELLRKRAFDGATITDVGSTKRQIVETADAESLPFVGGHPMAGRETAGAATATADLFRDRPWVVVPGGLARDADVERVEALAVATGARPIRLGAAEHDAAVAAISHLPLVVAAALVESVATGDRDWELARSLAATGWSDTTRLAKGDPEMGAGMLATNAAEVAGRLRSMRDVLDWWIDALEGEGVSDPSTLRSRLERARQLLRGGAPT